MLKRKIVRDIRENKMAYIACTVVIVIGLVAYTSMSIAKDNLFMAREEFYEQFHFADIFARVKAMPYSRINELLDIQGIELVHGRLVKDVRVFMPEQDKNIYLRMISLDADTSHSLNQVQLLKGSFPEKDERSILLGDKFFEAHHLTLNDSITVIIEGKKEELKISGTGQSPEYIYALKDAQAIAPDPEAFEVAYMSYESMERLFNQPGMVNDISFTLKQGFEFKDVEILLKNKLEKYGLESLVERKDQISHAMLDQELMQLENMTKSVPILFLGIAAIILYIMLKRLVESQRGQIGTLKAFGYRTKEIMWHYLSYGLAIGLAGGILGGLLGTALSIIMTRVYQTFFSLPNLEGRFSLKYLLFGIVLSVVFCMIAAYQGTKGILKLQPADAMRPSVPVFNKKVWLEKIPGFWAAFTVQGRMAVRNVIRNKGRSFFIFIGIVFTFSMMAAMWSMDSMIDVMVMEQFTKVQKQDVKITFTKPMRSDNIMREIYLQKGVHWAEPMIEVPITLKYLNRKKDVILLSSIENSRLYNLLDKDGNKIPMPEDGMLISELIARQLNVRVGDRVQVESIWAKDSPAYTYIAGIVPQYIGANVYMGQNALYEMLRQKGFATSVLISMADNYIPDLKEKYNTAQFIRSIDERQQSIREYEELLEMSTFVIWVMAAMAVITGFAIVYNTGIITLAERQRELASLRVLGMYPKEVLEVISVEQWFLGVLGIIAGIPMAFAMNKGLAVSMSSDLFSIPGITSTEALIQAFFGTIFAIWLAQKWVFRKVKQLDLVEVLKERD